MKAINLKKYISIILVIAMVLAIATGCGDKKKNENDETVMTEAVTEDNSEENSQDSTKENSQDSTKENTEDSTKEATEDNTEESSGGENGNNDDNGETAKDSVLTIVYTNDVHGYIANEKNIDEGTDNEKKVPALRLSNVSQMVKDMRAEGKEVLLVDAGDEIQGCTYGAIDEGESIIDIMNAAGYQLATVGNHEFDYGVNKLFMLAEKANFKYVSCNFMGLDGDEKINVFEDSKIFQCGDKKIAFVGVTTPGLMSVAPPVYFKNEKGEFIYTVEGNDNAEQFYASVQSAVDNVRQEADYVVLLGHVGVGMDEEKKKISSRDLIENISGADLFIDGHSHTTIEFEEVTDKDGKKVILTQTGSYLNSVGVIDIDVDGKITTKLINEYEKSDEEVKAKEDELIKKVEESLGKKIATLDTELYINNPDDQNQRLIRAKEMNSGDFVADAGYWYFNEKRKIDCDVVLANGGGIRSNCLAGDVKLSDVKEVQPFGNMYCLIEVTGQQIKDALELGTTETGEWDDEWNAPAENGGFMHVAGLKYTIDSTVESTVELDENGSFKSVKDQYRVKDIEVYNKETKSYEPLELDKKYSLGGIDYLLVNGGSGLSMFTDCEKIDMYVGTDVDIMAEYIEAFEKDGEYPKVNSKNSPLAAYEGYLLDYENPYGAGRINIIDK